MDLLALQPVPLLLAALTAVFVVRQVGTGKGIQPLKYAFTPLITALVIGVAITALFHHGINGYRALILSALVMSLVADTLLMVVEVDLMRYGILYFMLAHILYIIGFSIEFNFQNWHIFFIIAILAFLVFFYTRIRGKTSGLDTAVMVYSTVICLVIFFAAARLDHLMNRSTALSFAGALLFLLSDFAIALFTFIRPMKYESVIVWSLYAPAQLLIAFSCFG